MLGLELVVVLGVAVLGCSIAAARLRAAPPILLLAAGALAGFLPALRHVRLPPEAVLVLFLPALLFWESLTTSLREIRANLRGIVLMSTALVILTGAAVAVTAHAFGLSWGAAWVLGAALAPTDATAVGVLARALPRRNVTLLRAESLINDGTALVMYSLAVGIAVHQDHLSALYVGWRFLLAYGAGVLAGLVVALVGVRVRHRLDDPLQANLVTLLLPFTAFLLAEELHGSGVLAVVVCGLTMSQIGPRAGRADTRRQAEAFWSLATFVLNGALFVLVGLELHTAVPRLTSVALTRGIAAVGAVTAVIIAVRFAFMFAAVYVIRAVDRRPQLAVRQMSHRARVVSGLAGFRGAVSLAAVLAVPELIDTGEPFPGLDLIVFIAAGVVTTTIVVQGLLLPRVVRWAHLPRDRSVEQERHLAVTLAIEEAVAAMPQLAADLGVDPRVVDRLRAEYEDHLRFLHAQDSTIENDATPHHRDDTALRLALIARKRSTILRLRDQREIDDTVLRQVQTQLDIEEVRLDRRDVTD